LYSSSSLHSRVVIEDHDVGCGAVVPVDDCDAAVAAAATTYTASRGCRRLLLSDLLLDDLLLLLDLMISGHCDRRKVDGAKLGKVSEDVHAAQAGGV
jgi:hypothetical protein